MEFNKENAHEVIIRNIMVSALNISADKFNIFLDNVLALSKEEISTTLMTGVY